MIFRGKKEWIDGESPEFDWIKAFNAEDSFVPTGVDIDMILENAYGYVAKDSSPIVGLLIRARGDLNIAIRSNENPNGGFPLLGGRYMHNDIVQYDPATNRYLIDHEVRVPLDILNHIIYQNRPEKLRSRPNDGYIINNDPKLRDALKQWCGQHFVTKLQVMKSAVDDKPLFEDKPLAMIDDHLIVYRQQFQENK